MIDNNKIRWLVVFSALLVALVWMAPNFYDFSKDQWWFSKEKLIYGLDIQGGLHLVLGVEVNESIYEKLKSQGSDLKEVLEEEEIKVSSVQALKEKPGQALVRLEQSEDLEKAGKIIREKYTGSLLGGTSLRVLRSEGTELLLGYNEVELIRLRKSIVNQVVEVIRRRIDEFGVSEPVITPKGQDRVLVQLPGIQDSAHAKEIIQRTAKMEFRLVNEEIDSAQLMKWVKSAEEKGGYALNPQLEYRDYVEKINEDLQNQIPENNLLVFRRAEKQQ